MAGGADDVGLRKERIAGAHCRRGLLADQIPGLDGSHATRANHAALIDPFDIPDEARAEHQAAQHAQVTVAAGRKGYFRRLIDDRISLGQHTMALRDQLRGVAIEPRMGELAQAPPRAPK